MVIGEDPLSGHVFVFCNAAHNRSKTLYFERAGYWPVARRLEQGTFASPKVASSSSRKLEFNADDFMLLLGGLDPSRYVRRAWYERAK